MKITRIRLANYRGIDTIEVRLPRRGLCVLLGDNEAGKTSLVEAVDLLLHYPHDSRNQAVLATKPVHRDVGAEVEIDVEAGAFAFTYRKRYHVAPRSELLVHTPKPENKTGREAHERVRAILRQEVDLDLWHALRVSQGSIGEQPDLMAVPSLAQTLAQSAPQQSPQHEDLLDTVRREYERYFTPTGERRRALLDEAASVAQQQELVVSLTRATSEVENDAERSVELEHTLADRLAQRDAAAATCTQIGAEREVAQAHAFAVERSQHAAAAAEALLRGCERAVRLLRERDRLDAQHAQAHDSAGQSAAAKAAADHALTEATAQRDAARTRRDAAQRAVLRASKADKLASAARALTEWQALQHDLASRRPLAPSEVADLTRLSTAQTQAHARLAAQAAELCLRAAHDVSARVHQKGSEPTTLTLRAGEDHRLVVPTRVQLDLDGITVEVRAGQRAEDLAEAATHADTAMQAALRQLGVADVESARQHLGDQREKERGARELEGVLAQLLGEPDAARWARALDRLTAEVASLSDADPSVDLDAANAEVDRTEQACQAAQRAQLDAQASAQRAALVAANLHGGLQANAAARAALTEVGAAFASIEDAEKALPDAAAHFEAARRARATLLQQTVRSVEAVDADLTKHRAAQQAASRAAEQSHDELTTLRATLAVRGDEGLADRLGRAQQLVAQATHELDAKRRRAAAVAALQAALLAARDTCVQTYHQPIRERLEQLGRSVFGASFQVTVDERLQVTHRTLDGVTVPFRDLSLGAREQIAILLRLACAMAVAPSGGVPVWLDDALGQTDPERLHSMGQALRLAGERCQVVLLTCSPQRAQWPGAHVVGVRSRPSGAHDREAAG